MPSLTYLSLFSGIGGFELGIEEALRDYRTDRVRQATAPGLLGSGHRPLSDRVAGATACVGFSEINRQASTVYREHFPDHHPLGDIRGINEDDLPDFDLLCGGFPCQSFSIAGNQGGLEDERGALFFDIARIIRARKPSFLLLENVKGFLSHEGGQTALRCFSILDELGYDVAWQVLNSKDFGVPQNRERIFIVGHLRSLARPAVFPFLRKAADNGQPHYPLVGGDHCLRRLTPLECERMMGFPDHWTQSLADTHRYAVLGNAVVPFVVREICLRLLT